MTAVIGMGVGVCMGGSQLANFWLKSKHISSATSRRQLKHLKVQMADKMRPEFELKFEAIMELLMAHRKYIY